MAVHKCFLNRNHATLTGWDVLSRSSHWWDMINEGERSQNKHTGDKSEGLPFSHSQIPGKTKLVHLQMDNTVALTYSMKMKGGVASKTYFYFRRRQGSVSSYAWGHDYSGIFAEL